MPPTSRRFRSQLVRFEIFSDAGRWRWRFFDGLEEAPVSSRPLTLEQCIKAIQILKNTLAAPVFVVR